MGCQKDVFRIKMSVICYVMTYEVVLPVIPQENMLPRSICFLQKVHVSSPSRVLTAPCLWLSLQHQERDLENKWDTAHKGALMSPNMDLPSHPVIQRPVEWFHSYNRPHSSYKCPCWRDCITATFIVYVHIQWWTLSGKINNAGLKRNVIAFKMYTWRSVGPQSSELLLVASTIFFPPGFQLEFWTAVLYHPSFCGNI